MVAIFNYTKKESLFLHFSTNSFIPGRNEHGNQKMGKG
jgi:hypothetical protein